MAMNLFSVMSCRENAMNLQNVIKSSPLDTGISNNVMLYRNLSINLCIC
jgi:hypothetical protein